MVLVFCTGWAKVQSLVPSFPERVGQLRLATPHCTMFMPPPTLVKLGQLKVFRVLYTSEPRTPDELYFEEGVTISREGDIIYITDINDTRCWKGTHKGKVGLTLSNYAAQQDGFIDSP